VLRIEGKIDKFVHGTPLKELPKALQEIMIRHGYVFEDEEGDIEPSETLQSNPPQHPNISILERTVTEVKFFVSEIQDLDLLKLLLEAEEADKNRKSAIRSIKNRIESVKDGGN
tara:strand:+ start:22182 stop:22523 length:342 start_codon:yes stop_codon:yes gene_type:complete